MSTEPNVELVKAATEKVFPSVIADLKNLIEIPSISSMSTHDSAVEKTASQVAQLLEEVGCPEVKIVSSGGKPAVIGRFPAPTGQPTVLLYAHHDVQPASPEQGEWTSAPFEPQIRGDRLYGRGAADDKAGIATHIGALRVFNGNPPVGVTVFVEGEEEIGSPSLAKILADYKDDLEADVYVITDSLNWHAGDPAFTTTLRGVTDCIVKVETLTHPLHSGNFGGVAPDALTVLIKLLATLVDDQGVVQIAGLKCGQTPSVDYPRQQFQQEAQILDGVDFVGDGPISARLWTKPAVSVLAVESPSIAEASNTLAAHARAKISLRVAPGDDADQALKALVEHLESHVPLNAKLSIELGDSGQPGIVPMEGPIAELAIKSWKQAWGKDPVFIGCGGSIPMVSDFQQAFPTATVLVSAVADPDSRMHGVDESVFLPDLKASIEAEVRLIVGLAGKIGSANPEE